MILRIREYLFSKNSRDDIRSLDSTSVEIGSHNLPANIFVILFFIILNLIFFGSN